ncbi:tetratricopeptide repeat protein [Pelobium sp.]|nr:tetratricopeptide repeat protein [Pelobium sp.]MDA9555607.1 tetratricopeptide repeat protein [Pelobium sp.]
MKYFLILFTLTNLSLKAQTSLDFKKRFLECEDKWVAFQMNKDSSYNYGFIYIDPTAGLTLNYEGTFKINSDFKFIPKKLEKSNVKVRLQASNLQVALIPESKLEELKVNLIPDWLKFYKIDSNSIQRFYNLGYMYNGWNECSKGLTYLLKANEINSEYKGLAVELAFSYNCLEEFDKAIKVLKKALSTNPTDAYINKELIYAQLKSGKLDDASKSCKRALDICKDTSYNGENCYNLLRTFYEKKDKENFKLWLEKTKKWTSSNAELTKSINTMENNM